MLRRRNSQQRNIFERNNRNVSKRHGRLGMMPQFYGVVVLLFFFILILVGTNNVVSCLMICSPSSRWVTSIRVKKLSPSSSPTRLGRRHMYTDLDCSRILFKKKNCVMKAVKTGSWNEQEDDDETSPSSEVNLPLSTSASPGLWPCFDELDRRLIKISLPVIANFAINPIMGAVDLFWVNRMGNALAVAGQAAANQVFTSSFWLAAFLPSVTATIVSTNYASGNKEGVQDAVCQTIGVGMFISLVATILMLLYPNKILATVLKDGAHSLAYAKPYLLIRAFAFLPSILSVVGFSAFRGILETDTPVKISLFANVFNAVLDPILIFTLGMGVPGAALATLIAEIISAVLYMILMKKRDMIRLRKIFVMPSWAKLGPLLKGGAALQLRNVALNVAFIAVTRVTQSIDSAGIAAAAHAMAIQVFQVGGIVLLALSTVAQTVVPNALVERYDETQRRRIGGLQTAKETVNRLMSWGFVLGILLGTIQILLLPVLHKSTPLQEVRNAARTPSYLASLFQIMNGLVFIGEGVMVGCQSFMHLSISTAIATIGCLWALRTFPPNFGLTGVWISFGVWNLLRLTGVYIHQGLIGPLAPKNLKKQKQK